MRFYEFRDLSKKTPLVEAKGIFGRNPGDKFVHADGRALSIVEINAFPALTDNDETKLSQQWFNNTSKKYDNLETLEPKDKLEIEKELNKLSNADLKSVVDAQINFVSDIASEMLDKRGPKLVGKFADAADRDEAIKKFEQEHGSKIEWVNSPASNMLAFGVVTLDDSDGGHVYWGKYLQFTKPDMLGTWSNGQVPKGWSLATKGAQKMQVGYDPQNLIKTENEFASADEVIRTVESNAPDNVRNVFVEALKDLAQGRGDIEFPGMYAQQEAIRDYFGEIMQPVALMGGVILGQAEDARQVLADGAEWRDCKVMWPMAMNAALCDSFMIAPNGQEIGISTKGGAGAKASAKNLYDAYKKAEKEGNQDLIDNNKFTIEVVEIIQEKSSKEGPVALGEYLEIPGIDQNLQKEIQEYMDQGKSDLNGISEQAQEVLKPFSVKLETKGFNAGYAILSAVAKTVAAEVNKNPEFTKGAIALLNQSSIIQVYTKMGKRGDDAVLGEFRAVYPPNFEGKVVMDGGKNYYSSRVGGKMAFGFK